MKKAINLLIYHEKYKKTESFFLLIKKFVFVFLIFSIGLSILIFLILNHKKNQLNLLTNKKNQLRSELDKKKDVEIAYQIFLAKFHLLKEILKSDVNFYPYYQLINESLNKATISAFLDSIEIQKDKKTDFSVSFNDFNEMINFLSFVEDKNYLENFNQLTLKSFTLLKETGPIDESQKYQLQFTGKFKPQNEN